jgi:hypothetical protein
MGVLVRYTGDSLAFSPPLIVSEDQIDEIFNTVKKAIHMVEGHKEPDALIFLPILHSGSIDEFWIEHKRITEEMFSGVIN